MKTDVLEQILTSLKSVKKEAGSYRVDDSCVVTLMAQMGQELLTLSRVVRFETAKDICTVTTSKHERYFMPSELILALKVEQVESPAAVTAGFSRG